MYHDMCLHMFKQESDVFEITDFTTASEWERFAYFTPLKIVIDQ